MLKEIPETAQPHGEPRRRWFSNASFDLIVWHDPDDRLLGMQLCYDKGKDERALTWHENRGFSHRRVDDGEDRGGRHKMTPILLPDGTLKKDRILRAFEVAAGELDISLRDAVLAIIRRYPDSM